jgi:hypothetical protein
MVQLSVETLSVLHWSKDKDSPTLIARMPASFPRGKDHKVKIREEKGFLRIFVGAGDRPLLEVATPIPAGSLVTISNREPVAAVEQEGILSDPLIKALK